MTTPFSQLEEAVSLIDFVRRVGRAPPTFQRTLSPYLLLEEPAPSRVLDGEPLVRSLEPRDELVEVALDGTCRKVGCPYASQFIATAAVCTRSLHPIADYPKGPWKYPIEVLEEHSWIGLLPRLEADLEAGNAVRVFAGGYDEKQAYTELRTELETWMLEDVMPVAADLIEDLGGSPLIVLDGCVYFVPRSHFFDKSFYEYSELHMQYSNFYAMDIRRRLNAVDYFLSRGIPVVGVVKQTHHSNLLVKNNHVTDYARALGLRPELFAGDEAFALELFKLSLSSGLALPSICVATAPMEINYAEVGLIRGAEFRWLRNLLERRPKVYIYVGVLGHPLSDNPIQVYRLETTRDVYRRFGEELWMEVLGDASMVGLMLPGSLMHSHRRCIDWAGSLQSYSEMLFSSRSLPIERDIDLLMGLMGVG